MKIGIIVDSTKVPWYIYDLIKWIKQNSHFTIEVLFIQNIKNQRKPLISENFFKILDRFLFKIINVIEKKIIKKKYPQYNKHFFKFDLKKFNIKEIDVEFKKFQNETSFVYDKSSIEKIKQLNLDIIIRGGSGILKGEILNCSRFGIISFHHGDNLFYRGKPSGFWEVKEKNSKTGFTIQILNEQLDAGDVLKRGNFRTQQFYYLNDILLKERSNYYMKSILNEISKTNRLPKILSNHPYYKKIYTSPNFVESSEYLFSRIYEKIKNFILGIFFNEVWHVGYQSNRDKVFNPQNSKVINNPKNTFLADPFVVENKNEHYIFLEEYNFKNKKGIISVYKIFSNGPQKVGVAIEENFHLSFPFVFKYQNNYYMVPETKEKNEIRLYKCEHFPLKWKYEKTILKSINATDSIIFKFNDYWWLITTYSNCGRFNESELHVFYSKEGPITDNWIGLKKNPVVIDPDLGRNGGIFFEGKKIFRVAQSFGFNNYGKKISLREIIKLDPENFVEKEIRSIEPKFLKKLLGIHHLHSNNIYSVHDFCKREFKY